MIDRMACSLLNALNMLCIVVVVVVVDTVDAAYCIVNMTVGADLRLQLLFSVLFNSGFENVPLVLCTGVSFSVMHLQAGSRKMMREKGCK